MVLGIFSIIDNWSKRQQRQVDLMKLLEKRPPRKAMIKVGHWCNRKLKMSIFKVVRWNYIDMLDPITHSIRLTKVVENFEEEEEAYELIFWKKLCKHLTIGQNKPKDNLEKWLSKKLQEKLPAGMKQTMHYNKIFSYLWNKEWYSNQYTHWDVIKMVYNEPKANKQYITIKKGSKLHPTLQPRLIILDIINNIPFYKFSWSYDKIMRMKNWHFSNRYQTWKHPILDQKVMLKLTLPVYYRLATWGGLRSFYWDEPWLLRYLQRRLSGLRLPDTEQKLKALHTSRTRSILLKQVLNNCFNKSEAYRNSVRRRVVLRRTFKTYNRQILSDLLNKKQWFPPLYQHVVKKFKKQPGFISPLEKTDNFIDIIYKLLYKIYIHLFIKASVLIHNMLNQSIRLKPKLMLLWFFGKKKTYEEDEIDPALLSLKNKQDLQKIREIMKAYPLSKADHHYVDVHLTMLGEDNRYFSLYNDKFYLRSRIDSDRYQAFLDYDIQSWPFTQYGGKYLWLQTQFKKFEEKYGKNHIEGILNEARYQANYNKTTTRLNQIVNNLDKLLIFKQSHSRIPKKMKLERPVYQYTGFDWNWKAFYETYNWYLVRPLKFLYKSSLQSFNLSLDLIELLTGNIFEMYEHRNLDDGSSFDHDPFQQKNPLQQRNEKVNYFDKELYARYNRYRALNDSLNINTDIIKEKFAYKLAMDSIHKPYKTYYDYINKYLHDLSKISYENTIYLQKAISYAFIKIRTIKQTKPSIFRLRTEGYVSTRWDVNRSKYMALLKQNLFDRMFYADPEDWEDTDMTGIEDIEKDTNDEVIDILDELELEREMKQEDMDYFEFNVFWRFVWDTYFYQFIRRRLLIQSRKTKGKTEKNKKLATVPLKWSKGYYEMPDNYKRDETDTNEDDLEKLWRLKSEALFDLCHRFAYQKKKRKAVYWKEQAYTRFVNNLANTFEPEIYSIKSLDQTMFTLLAELPEQLSTYVRYIIPEQDTPYFLAKRHMGFVGNLKRQKKNPIFQFDLENPGEVAFHKYFTEPFNFRKFWLEIYNNIKNSIIQLCLDIKNSIVRNVIYIKDCVVAFVTSDIWYFLFIRLPSLYLKSLDRFLHFYAPIKRWLKYFKHKYRELREIIDEIKYEYWDKLEIKYTLNTWRYQAKAYYKKKQQEIDNIKQIINQYIYKFLNKIDKAFDSVMPKHIIFLKNGIVGKYKNKYRSSFSLRTPQMRKIIDLRNAETLELKTRILKQVSSQINLHKISADFIKHKPNIKKMLLAGKKASKYEFQPLKVIQEKRLTSNLLDENYKLTQGNVSKKDVKLYIAWKKLQQYRTAMLKTHEIFHYWDFITPHYPRILTPGWTPERMSLRYLSDFRDFRCFNRLDWLKFVWKCIRNKVGYPERCFVGSGEWTFNDFSGNIDNFKFQWKGKRNIAESTNFQQQKNWAELYYITLPHLNNKISWKWYWKYIMALIEISGLSDVEMAFEKDQQVLNNKRYGKNYTYTNQNFDEYLDTYQSQGNFDVMQEINMKLKDRAFQTEWWNLEYDTERWLKDYLSPSSQLKTMWNLVMQGLDEVQQRHFRFNWSIITINNYLNQNFYDMTGYIMPLHKLWFQKIEDVVAADIAASWHNALSQMTKKLSFTLEYELLYMKILKEYEWMIKMKRRNKWKALGNSLRWEPSYKQFAKYKVYDKYFKFDLIEPLSLMNNEEVKNVMWIKSHIVPKALNSVESSKFIDHVQVFMFKWADKFLEICITKCNIYIWFGIIIITMIMIGYSIYKSIEKNIVKNKEKKNIQTKQMTIKVKNNILKIIKRKLHTTKIEVTPLSLKAKVFKYLKKIKVGGKVYNKHQLRLKYKLIKGKFYKYDYLDFKVKTDKTFIKMQHNNNLLLYVNKYNDEVQVSQKKYDVENIYKYDNVTEFNKLTYLINLKNNKTYSNIITSITPQRSLNNKTDKMPVKWLGFNWKPWKSGWILIFMISASVTICISAWYNIIAIYQLIAYIYVRAPLLTMSSLPYLCLVVITFIILCGVIYWFICKFVKHSIVKFTGLTYEKLRKRYGFNLAMPFHLKRQYNNNWSLLSIFYVQSLKTIYLYIKYIIIVISLILIILILCLVLICSYFIGSVFIIFILNFIINNSPMLTPLQFMLLDFYFNVFHCLFSDIYTNGVHFLLVLFNEVIYYLYSYHYMISFVKYYIVPDIIRFPTAAFAADFIYKLQLAFLMCFYIQNSGKFCSMNNHQTRGQKICLNSLI